DARALAVFSSIVLVTLITGVTLYVLGRLNLGNVIRFVPYPVIGGFLAGSGWLLLVGSVRITTGLPLSPKFLPELLESRHLVRWTPAIGLGILLFWAWKQKRHRLVVPFLLLLSILSFYVVKEFSGLSLSDARQGNWLFNFPAQREMHLMKWFSALRISSP